MKFHSFSLVVGTRACNAGCPFCVSKMTDTGGDLPSVNWDRFYAACDIAEAGMEGYAPVLLTGNGEPLLHPGMIDEYLGRLAQRKFPTTELITNGSLIEKNLKRFRNWRHRGLSLVSLSIVHWQSYRSNDLMRIRMRYDQWATVDKLHDLGFSVRLNCTLTEYGMYEPWQVERLLCECREHGVEQVTLREVEQPSESANPDVSEWVSRNKPVGAAATLHEYLDKRATRLLRLPHGGIVYDYCGQNVCVANCLTASEDPDDIRQLIFFPDGRISYSWEHQGARIL